MARRLKKPKNSCHSFIFPLPLGILPGVSIQVVQKFPSYVLKIGHSQIAMDEEMARDVFIRPG